MTKKKLGVIILFFLISSYCIYLMILIIIGLTTDHYASLRNELTEYFSEDNNYQELNGIVIKYYDNLNDTQNIDNILIIKISTENHGFQTDIDGYQAFRLMCYGDRLDIKAGDEISFVSAPGKFYILPIVALEKEGQVYLSFEEGKKAYLEWIQKEFQESE